MGNVAKYGIYNLAQQKLVGIYGQYKGGGASDSRLITEWTVSAGQTITLQGQIGGGATYLFDVDWGDSNSDTGLTTATETHTYTSAGTYVVKISGQFSGFRFLSAIAADQAAITKFVQWGTETTIQGLYGMFHNCTNMVWSATDNPTILITSGVTNYQLARNIFSSCTSITSLDLSGWVVGNENLIVSCYLMCDGMTNLEYFNMTGVDFTSNTTFSYMFRSMGNATALGCEFIYNDTTSLSGTFSNAFAGAKFSSFSMTDATITSASFAIQYMFLNTNMVGGAEIDLSNWSGNCVGFIYAFRGVIGEPSLNMTGWTTNNATSFYGMFYLSTINNITGLDGFSGLSATTCEKMFYNATYLKFDTNNFDADFGSGWSCTSLKDMFFGVSKNTTSGTVLPDMSNWDTNTITDFSGLYNGFKSSVASIVMPDMSSATNVGSMFYTSVGIINVDFSGSNWSNTVTSLVNLVRSTDVETIDFSGCDFSGLTSLSHFGYCCDISSLTFDPLVSFASLDYGHNFLATNCGGGEMTTAEYDHFLVRLDVTGLTGAYSITFGVSKYTIGGAGETARANLVGKGWTIADGGGV